MFILLHESIINRIIKEQTDHYQSALYYTPDVAKGCSVIENFSCICLFDDHDFCVVHISRKPIILGTILSHHLFM